MDTTEMKHEVDRLQSELRDARSKKKDMEKNLRRINTKMHYSGETEELTAERDAIVDALTDHDEHLAQLTEQYEQAEKDLHRAQVEMERERLANQATGYHFSVPDDDPIVGCQMLSAIADRLQYQFLSSQGYYEYLCGQIYGNRAGTDHEGMASPEDHPNPEIARTDLDRLEEIRAQREYLQTLRFAVEAEFNKMAENIPEDATYRPQLLRRSDHQVLDDIERRRERRFEQQREQREAAQATARDFTRSVDLNVYQPGKVA